MLFKAIYSDHFIALVNCNLESFCFGLFGCWGHIISVPLALSLHQANTEFVTTVPVSRQTSL